MAPYTTSPPRLNLVTGGPASAPPILGSSGALRLLLAQAERLAHTDLAVVLTGESGTGKSHLARFIHAHSQRASGPFVAVNCAALPSTLLEAELFGVRRGAFTGATEDRPGVFLEAHRGTLFLDEVGEMSLELQPKLLLALESGTVRPVGGRGPTTVDVRIIAATNRDLHEALRERAFRQDLYYRLNVIAIEVPPLRHRREDIPALIQTILTSLAASGRSRRPIRGVTPAALELLSARPWPGNVRELRHRVAALYHLAEHDLLDAGEPEPAPARVPGEGLVRAVAPLTEIERDAIALALRQTGGDARAAARLLAISRSSLYEKLHRYGLDRTGPTLLAGRRRLRATAACAPATL
jgi:transcriptional regulator with PAS, ATPase and Fis domain